MSPLQVIEKARACGVSLCLTERQSIEFRGERQSIDALMPLLQAHKAQLIQWLEFCDLYAHIALMSGWVEADRQEWCKDLAEQPELTLECLRALRRSWSRGGYGHLTLSDWVEGETKNNLHAIKSTLASYFSINDQFNKFKE